MNEKRYETPREVLERDFVSDGLFTNGFQGLGNSLISAVNKGNGDESGAVLADVAKQAVIATNLVNMPIKANIGLLNDEVSDLAHTVRLLAEEIIFNTGIPTYGTISPTNIDQSDVNVNASLEHWYKDLEESKKNMRKLNNDTYVSLYFYKVPTSQAVFLSTAQSDWGGAVVENGQQYTMKWDSGSELLVPEAKWIIDLNPAGKATLKFELFEKNVQTADGVRDIYRLRIRPHDVSGITGFQGAEKLIEKAMKKAVFIYRTTGNLAPNFVAGMDVLTSKTHTMQYPTDNSNSLGSIFRKALKVGAVVVEKAYSYGITP